MTNRVSLPTTLGSALLTAGVLRADHGPGKAAGYGSWSSLFLCCQHHSEGFPCSHWQSFPMSYNIGSLTVSLIHRGAEAQK